MTEFTEATGPMTSRERYPLDGGLKTVLDRKSGLFGDCPRLHDERSSTRKGIVASIENPPPVSSGRLVYNYTSCKNNSYFMIHRDDACFAVRRDN